MGKACSKMSQSDKANHDRLGVVHILSGNENETRKIQLQKRIQNIHRFSQWQKQICLYMQQDFKEVFYLPERYQFQQDGMCGTSGLIQVPPFLSKMDFEYYKYTLKNEINSRYHSRQVFDETQLWYLLYNILQAAFLLQPIGKRIGDVHPNNILINQKGRIKIIPVSLFPNTKNAYQRIVEEKTSEVYLAPEELDKILIEKGIYPHVDACKAEVFSIGMTLLYAARLQDSQYLYDRKNLRVISEKKKSGLEELALRFSTYFCSIVSQLLEEDPQKRRKSSDFFRQLNKHQDDILSLKRFNHIQNKIREAFPKDDVSSQQPSIADMLSDQIQKQGLIPTPRPTAIQPIKRPS